MAARESVIVLIAESSVDNAACEPAAVVRSIEETPAPAVVVTVAVPSVKPADNKADAVLPETLMPACAVVDKVTDERTVDELLVVDAVTVPLIPVAAAVLPVSSSLPVELKETEPAVFTAVTPVDVVLALIDVVKLSNLLLLTCKSATSEPDCVAIAVTLEPLAAPVVNPAWNVPL